LVGCLVGAGCAGGPEPASRDASFETGESMLDRCAREDLAPPTERGGDVRAYHCGELTLVEAVVLSASERDVAIAFDEFAAAFAGETPKRVDSVYTSGDARHTWMRLEGKTTSGAAVEAQMVAVVRAGGVRLVTCSTKSAQAPCGPVVASLVHGRQ
jgi:hypothetical protein